MTAPPIDNLREFLRWLHSLDDEQLLDYRAELFDRFEVGGGEGVEAALNFVANVLEMRHIARTEHPDLNGQVVASALYQLAIAALDLGIDHTTPERAAELFAGAIEVAERRHDQNGGGDGR